MTLTTLGAGIIAAVGLLLTILNIIDRIAGWTSKAGEPLRQLEARTTNIEEEIRDLKREFTEKTKVYDDTFKGNIDDINTVRETMIGSTKVIMQALEALMLHAIDGNNIDALRESKEKLQKFLYDQMS